MRNPYKLQQIASILIFLAASTLASAQEWPCVQHDPQHTGRSPRYVFDVDPVVKWSAATGGSVFGSPIIRTDGSIVASAGNDKAVHAFAADGAALWSYDAAGAVLGSPATLADGSVLFSDSEGYTYTLNADGTLATSTQNDPTPKAEKRNICDMTPRPGGGYGTGDWFSRLVFNISGSESSFPLGGYPVSPVTFSTTGSTAYYAYRPDNTTSRIASINPLTGSANWTMSHIPGGGTKGPQVSGICLDQTNSRMFYCANFHQASSGSWLYSYSTGGVKDTEFPINLGTAVYSTPALAPDGSAIYIATLDGRVFKHSATTGAQIWTYDSGALAIRGSVVVDSAGKIFFGDSSGYVHCVNANGNLVWKSACLDGVIASSPAIASNGDVVIATTNGKVVRLGMETLVIPYLLNKTPVLDGVLSPNEWNGAWTTTIDSSTPLLNPGWECDRSEALGLADCSYDVYVMHNGSKLYIAFDINDEVVKATQAPDPDMAPPVGGTAAQCLYEVWWDDCTEVFIDTYNDDVNEGQAWPGVQEWQEGIHPHYGALGHVWTRPDNPNLTGTFNTVWNNAIQAVSIPRPGGYIQEWEIDLSKFDSENGPGFTPVVPGDTIGFNVLVNDDDSDTLPVPVPATGDTRENQVVWMGAAVTNYATGSKPQTWPHAILSANPIEDPSGISDWEKN